MVHSAGDRLKHQSTTASSRSSSGMIGKKKPSFNQGRKQVKKFAPTREWFGSGKMKTIKEESKMSAKPRGY